MTTVRVLAIAALLVGGTSLTLAQNGPPTGGQPRSAGNPPAAPSAAGPPGPGVIPHDAPAGTAASVQQSAAPPAAGPPGPGAIPHDAPAGTAPSVQQSAAPSTAGPPGPGVIPHDAPRSGLQSAATNMQSAAPQAGAAAGTRIAGQPKHPKKMYMSTRSTKFHKGSKLTPASSAKPYMKQ
jgi:hypothetical protein